MTKCERDMLNELDELRKKGWDVQLGVSLERGEYRIAQIHSSRWIAWIYETDENVGDGFATLAEAVAAVEAHREQGSTGSADSTADAMEVA